MWKKKKAAFVIKVVAMLVDTPRIHKITFIAPFYMINVVGMRNMILANQTVHRDQNKNSIECVVRYSPTMMFHSERLA